MLPLQWRDGRAQSNIVVRASLSMSVCHVLSGEITLWSCPIEVHVPEGHMTGSVSEHVSLPRMCRVGTGAERLMACGKEVRGPRPVKRGGSPTRFLTWRNTAGRYPFPGPATVSPCNSAPAAARQKARRWQYVPVSVFRQSPIPPETLQHRSAREVLLLELDSSPARPIPIEGTKLVLDGDLITDAWNWRDLLDRSFNNEVVDVQVVYMSKQATDR